MPSLCSSRSTVMPGVPLGTTKLLIAARPWLLSRVAQTTTASHRSPEVTKIFSPLMTYSSPSRTAVVAMLAESEPVARLGDRHARPDPGEPLLLLGVGDRRDGGVAESLARQGQQEADVAPAHLRDAEHRGEVGAVLHPTVGLVLAPDSGGARPVAGAGLREPVDHGGEEVELLGVGVLGRVVLAADRTQHVHGDLVGLVAQGDELLRVVEVDGHTRTPPSITPMARRSRYHRSTGCSFTKPWPPSSWTPSRPIFMPLLAQS